MQINFFSYSFILSGTLLLLHQSIVYFLFRREEKLKLLPLYQVFSFFLLLNISYYITFFFYSRCKIDLEFDYPEFCNDPFGVYFVWTPVLLITSNLLISFFTLMKNKVKKGWWGLVLSLFLCLLITAASMFMTLYMT
jgi:hypothetical protein